MAWRRLQHDIALDWSATSLLDASIDVVVAFLVFICAIINFGTASFLRVSGLHIPCNSCALNLQKPQVSTFDKDSQTDVVEKDSSVNISSGIPSIEEEGSCNVDYSDSPLEEVEAMTIVPDSLEISPFESFMGLMEDNCENGDGGAAEDGSLLLQSMEAEEFKDREREALNREQDLIDRELMEALQSERDTLAALYSELEEERNASATAASEALAMISRLQEEKAAVQMEARQFQRMVLEKAMYDQEAIEVLKEILAKREEEKIVLEDEIRLCKEKLQIVLMQEKDLKAEISAGSSDVLMPEGSFAEVNGLQKLESDISFNSIIGITAQAVKEEQAKYVEILNKTKSELLTALQERAIEPGMNDVEDSGGFASAINKGKSPLRAGPLPVLEFGNGNGLRQIGSAKDSYREEATSVLEVENVKVPSTFMEESISVASELHKENGKLPPKAVPVSDLEDKLENTGSGLGSSKTGAENVVRNPLSGGKRQTGKVVIRNEGKVDEPEFASLKRRWNSRGSQEVSIETLNKAKEDRRIEEKRLSVLEYVWKFEEQLQQQGGRPPVQIVKQKSTGDPASRSQSPVRRSSSLTSRNADGVMQPALSRADTLPQLSRDDTLRRRLFEEEEGTETDSSTKVGNGSFERPMSFPNDDDGKDYDANIEISEDGVDEALFVHDVHEVQNPPYEASGLVMGDAGRLSSVEMHQHISDRLEKPDYVNFKDEDTRDEDEQETDYLSNASVFPQGAEDLGKETQWEDLQGRVRYKNLLISTSLKKENSRTIVEEEVETLTQRLKALEADRYIMKQTIESLRRENGEMKLLQEIAQQLRELRGMEQMDLELKDRLPLPLDYQVIEPFHTSTSAGSGTLGALQYQS